MKRQRIRNAEYRELLDQTNDDDYNGRYVPMQRQRRIRQENVLEAQIQPGDTLQAIALRYNCTISDLKRLNKIEKEIEIHARKTIKVPVNAHTILLNTAKTDELPMVHKSGQNSPKHLSAEINKENFTINGPSHNQPLPNNINGLNEKLLVASVSLATSSHINDEPNCSVSNPFSTNDRTQINDLIMKSDILTRQQYQKDHHHHRIQDDNDEESVFSDPLLQTDIDEYSTLRSGPHVIRGAPRNKYTFSGSDCDISWICLLIFILALCFAIPLIYVIYIAEHPDKFSQEDKPHLSTTGSSSIVNLGAH